MSIPPVSIGHDDMWRQHSACRRGFWLYLFGLWAHIDFDLDLFFPEDGHKIQARIARQVCSACPVAEDCLNYALDNFIRDGIWGGTSERQRRVLQRRRRRVAS